MYGKPSTSDAYGMLDVAAAHGGPAATPPLAIVHMVGNIWEPAPAALQLRLADYCEEVGQVPRVEAQEAVRHGAEETVKEIARRADFLNYYCPSSGSSCRSSSIGASSSSSDGDADDVAVREAHGEPDELA